MVCLGQFTFYYAFCAVVVIYVIAIQEGPTSQACQAYMHVAAATKCQRKLLAIAEANSLGARYCLVLEELRKELASQSARLQSAQNEGTSAQEPLPVQTTNGPQPSDPILPLRNDEQGHSMHMMDQAVLDHSPGSSLHDLSGWGAFDSMVCFAPFLAIHTSRTTNEGIDQTRSYPASGTSTFSVMSHSPFEILTTIGKYMD